MQKVRIATFNAENLFIRYLFNEKKLKIEKAVKDGFMINQMSFEVNDKKSKQITAEAIKATKADVIALQEIENLNALKEFRRQFLDSSKLYPHALLIDGNDPRMIDVAVLSKYPIIHARSYQHLKSKDEDKKSVNLFSRDCLEIDVVFPGDKRITLFINHFKSMLDMKHPCDGRAYTRPKREKQSQGVIDVVSERFGKNPGKEKFIVLGDLNDYLQKDKQGTTGIKDLVCWDQVENVVDRLNESERWTHFFKGNTSCKIPESYRQLDYILLSKSLAESTKAKPEIIRSGMPKRATKYTGKRFDGVGQNEPKASDHCPVVMEVSI